jgi:hypothetical protein
MPIAKPFTLAGRPGDQRQAGDRQGALTEPAREQYEQEQVERQHEGPLTGEVEAKPAGAGGSAHDDHGGPEHKGDADENGSCPNPIEEPPAREAKKAAEQGRPEVEEPVCLGIEVKRLADRLGEKPEPVSAARERGDHGRGRDADVDPLPRGAVRRHGYGGTFGAYFHCHGPATGPCYGRRSDSGI